MKNRNVLLMVAVFLGMISGLTAQNVPSYVPTNGLVGWWPFNGNANDESGNGYNGTSTNVEFASDRFGNSNASARFPDGNTNSNILLGSHHYSTFSYSLWYKINVPTTHEFGVLASNYLDGNGFEIQIGGGNKLTFILSNGASWGSFMDTSAIELNKWHHIMVTFNGQFGKMYKNGTLVLNGFNTGTMTEVDSLFEPNFQPGNQLLTFGDRTNGNVFEFNFEGFLDDIAIYNRALNQQEITALYQGGNSTANCMDLPTNLQQGLVGYWPFCGNALDESGNGNHGTVNGATLTTDRFGNAGSAYDFDGVDDYIGCGNWNIGPSSFTLSAWVKESEVGSSPSYFISKFDGESLPFPDNNILRSWMLYRHSASNGSKYVFEMSQDGQVAQGLFFNQFGELNIWKHLSVTFNNGQVKSYVNGSLDSVFNSNFTSVFQSSVPVYFGISAKDNAPEPNSQNWMQGTLDDIAIWNRALSQQEITQLYNQGICKTSITVTDTLLIHTGITSYNPVAYQNTLKVWPNPGNQDITIDAGNLALMQGWKIRVSNAQGVQIYPSGSQSGLINQQQETLDMSGWGGNGLYFLYLIDPQNNIQEVKKIVLAP